MKIKKCDKCRELFTGRKEENLCRKCRNELEKEITKLHDYIYENPKVSFNAIVENDMFEITKKELKRLIRKGRVELNNTSGEITCKKCGTEINKGDYCKGCKKNLNNKLKKGFNNKDKKKEKRGMYIKED